VAELVYLPAGRQARNNMTYSVYAIKSIESNYIYVGMSSDVEKRLNEHNNGKTRSTKPYGPFRLVYEEHVGSRDKARSREKYLKSGTGKEFLKTLI
jgi:putative endonuclease